MSSTVEIDALPEPPRDVIPEGEDDRLRKLSLEEKSLAVPGISHPDDFKPPRSKSKSPVPVPTNGKEMITQLLRNLNGKKADGPSTIIISQSSGVQIGDTTNVNFTNSVQYTDPMIRDKYFKPSHRRVRKSSSKDEYNALRNSTEPVTLADIDTIRYHVGKSWRDVGRKLGYSEGELDAFKLDNMELGIKEVIYNLLLDWQRNSDDATVGALSTCLFEANVHEALHKWYKMRGATSP